MTAQIRGLFSSPNKRATSSSKFALKIETSVQILESMRFQPAYADGCAKPCYHENLAVSSPLPKPLVMNSKPSVFRPLLAGFFVYMALIFVVVVFLFVGGVFFFCSYDI